MKLALRFTIPLFFIIGFLVLISERHFGALQERWFTKDLNARASLVANLVQDDVENHPEDVKKSQYFLNRITKDERLSSLAVCGNDGTTQARTSRFPKSLKCEELGKITSAKFFTRQLESGRMHIGVFPLLKDGTPIGNLVTVHDMSFINMRARAFQRYVALAFIILALVTSVLAAWIAQLSWKGWLDNMVVLVRNFRSALENPRQITTLSAYTPIVKDLRRLVKDLETRRIARDETLQSWTPKALKEILHDELSGEQIIIVSNREPFIHLKTEKGVEIQKPASGLVTALEPVMEACSGVWVAHGSGSADRDVVDDSGKIRVPPEKPTYSLRRVWLTEEEEQGYYYGFANEGLWPLCHIAHTRPIFRSQDYAHYRRVNQYFADVVIEEAKNDEPVILIQDYHFALMPAMIRRRLPKAVIVTFWHIPWPNPEVFGICPWREELIEGLLGSSIVGFHTQFHCNNFFDSADRFLECRIDRESSSISYNGVLTGVKPYPISIEWPPKYLTSQSSIGESREKIRRLLGLPSDALLGIGVDRLDYTKGIVERFLAVEALLDRHPEWRGRFSFVQIAAPSRSQIPSYRMLHDQVVSLADRINKKFGEMTGFHKTIILRIEHHEPPLVYSFLRAADLCYVSSLHDGMNLVAKEFVAAREDEMGVLILSSFTGASREMPEALIVNPYNIDQAAACLHAALSMPVREQKERMKSMRSLISEYNVYRWAGRMLLDASTVKKKSKFKRWVDRNRSHAGLSYV